MSRVIRIVLWIALIVVTGLAFVVRVRYGGGQPYPDVTGAPILSGNELETVLSYPEPIGNVAMSADGRGFFTVHPESRPEGAKLLEFRDGAACPTRARRCRMTSSKRRSAWPSIASTGCGSSITESMVSTLHVWWPSIC